MSRLFAGFLVFVLLLGGCGNNSKQSGDDTDTGSDTDNLDAASDVADQDVVEDATDAEAELDAEVPFVPQPDGSEWAFEKDHLLLVEIELPEESWDFLRVQGRSLFDIFGEGCLDGPFPSPFTWMRGSVRIDGELVEDVAIRKKGFLGSLSATKPSLKLDFDNYVPDRRYRALERMTFNNARQDRSYLNQCLSYDLFRAAGMPAPRCNFANVHVNGVDLGVYVHVEQVKKAFLRRHFPDDEGKLYEGTLSDFRPEWHATFDKKTNKDDDDSRAEIAAATSALEVDDSELEASLSAVFDVENFYRFWALEDIVAHWDGYSGNTNNFLIYANPDNGGLFHFIPWGADATFQSLADRQGPDVPESLMVTGRLARRLYAHPTLTTGYEDAMRDILDNTWDETAILAEIDRMEALILPVMAPSERAEVQTHIERKRAFVRVRKAALLSELDRPPISPLPDERSEICGQVTGTVSGTFDTSWDTAAVDDIFSTGTGTLVVDDTGFMGTASPVGAKVGLGTDNDNMGRAVLTVAGFLPNGLVLVGVFETEASNIVPGTIAVDWVETEGTLLVFNPATGDFWMHGFVTDGTINLTDAGTTDGAVVQGSWSGSVLRLDL